MAEILKTWPGFFTYKQVQGIFRNVAKWERFFFTLGRGKPQQEVTRLWFTWRGRIIGSVPVESIVLNDGYNLPKLRRLDGEPSEWQIKPDRWVAIGVPPFEWLKERIYHDTFRGWRYFDLAVYRETLDAKVRL